MESLYFVLFEDGAVLFLTNKPIQSHHQKNARAYKVNNPDMVLSGFLAHIQDAQVDQNYTSITGSVKKIW